MWGQVAAQMIRNWTITSMGQATSIGQCSPGCRRMTLHPNDQQLQVTTTIGRCLSEWMEIAAIWAGGAGGLL